MIMKKFENTFAITGFVALDATVNKFQNNSVARFPLSISRKEKNGEEENRKSALLNIEVWSKNDNTNAFDLLKKGNLVTVEGYMKPEEWEQKTGTGEAKKYNKIVFTATKVYEPVEKEESK